MLSRGYTQIDGCAKPTPCCRVAYARDVLSYVPTRTACVAKCKNLAASSKKPTQTAYAKAVTRRIQEPTRAAYANPRRMHTFHNFAYATFRGVPFSCNPFISTKNAAHMNIQQVSQAYEDQPHAGVNMTKSATLVLLAFAKHKPHPK